MKSTLHHEIVIERSAQEVWRVLADLVAVADYNPGVATADWMNEEREGVGAGRTCALLPKGSTTETVTVWEPERALGLQMESTPWPPITSMSWVTRIESVGAGTVRIEQDLDYELGAGMLGRVLNALALRRTLWKNLDSVLQQLKLHIETMPT